MEATQITLPLFSQFDFEPSTRVDNSRRVATKSKDIVIQKEEIALNETKVSSRGSTEIVGNALKNSINKLVSVQYEEKDIQNARSILGDKASQLNDEQLTDTISEINFLVKTWMDEFERGIFNGQTLNEVLHEKGGL